MFGPLPRAALVPHCGAVTDRCVARNAGRKGPLTPAFSPQRGEGATLNAAGSWVTSIEQSSGLFSASIASLRFHLRVLSAWTSLCWLVEGERRGEVASWRIGRGRGTAETRWTQSGVATTGFWRWGTRRWERIDGLLD